ncbi:hypothetical protein AB8O64_19680 [Streptomyces sp. QH1-20]|uniref:hypothetical protein n=1 Tax=Streptomyces sp. QH1-20 TaxID=3240934 RepID=UPI003513AF78
MSTATLYSPRTNDYVQAEHYRITGPATPSTAKLARDSVRAVLAVTRRPRLIDAARVCVSDAVAHVLPLMSGPVLTVDMSVHPSRVIISVGDACRDSRSSRRTMRREMDAEPVLRLLCRLTHAAGVTRTWNNGRIATQVWFELHNAGAVHG